MSTKINELSINELRHVCEAGKLGFASTKELAPLEKRLLLKIERCMLYRLA